MATQNTIDEVWKCRDGREIPVSKLEPEHMRAILNMLLRNKRLRIKREEAEAKHLDDIYNEVVGEDRKWGKS